MAIDARARVVEGKGVPDREANSGQITPARSKARSVPVLADWPEPVKTRTRGHESKISARRFVKVDCTACHHVPLLRLEALLRVGLAARPTFFTQKAAVAVRRKGRAVVSVKRRAQGG